MWWRSQTERLRPPLDMVGQPRAPAENQSPRRPLGESPEEILDEQNWNEWKAFPTYEGTSDPSPLRYQRNVTKANSLRWLKLPSKKDTPLSMCLKNVRNESPHSGKDPIDQQANWYGKIFSSWHAEMHSKALPQQGTINRTWKQSWQHPNLHIHQRGAKQRGQSRKCYLSITNWTVMKYFQTKE